jgi:predicted HTH transcriptional regulator
VTDEELHALVAKGESARLEFKNRLPRDTTSLANLLTGFANAQGGKLVVGYSEPSQQFVGVGDHERAEQRLATVLEHVEPKLNVNWEFVPVDEKEALIVDVPRGPDFPYSAGGLAMLRRGEQLVPLPSEAVVQRAAQDSAPLANDPVLRQLADALARANQKIDTIEKRGRVARTVPVSAGAAVLGAIAGYALKALDPLKDVL